MIQRVFQSFYSWFSGVQPLPHNETFSFQILLDDLEVGTLRAEKGEWVFAYSDAFRHQDKISPIVDFPVLDREYRGKSLWPFFALRIPSPKQAVVREFIECQPDHVVDQGMLLRQFGSRSIANPFRLVPLAA
jgi:HipA-like protein